MASSDHKKYVKSYLRSHKNGEKQLQSLKSRFPSNPKLDSPVEDSGFESSVQENEDNIHDKPSPVNAELNSPGTFPSPSTSKAKADQDHSATDQSPPNVEESHDDRPFGTFDESVETKTNGVLNSRPKTGKRTTEPSKAKAGRNVDFAEKLNSLKITNKSNASQRSSSNLVGLRPKVTEKKATGSSVSKVKGSARKNQTPHYAVGPPKISNLISLPDELQLRILAFLSPGDLLVCARVCKHWNYLANDNVLWKKLYDHAMAKKSKNVGKQGKSKEESFQYWKWKCVKRCTEDRNQVLKLLKKIDNYTGLPKHTDKCLQTLAVKWRLAFVDRDGVESFIDHRDVFYQRISISVRWYDLQIPPVNRMKVLRLYAACPVFFEKDKPLKNSACQLSLLYEFDLDWSRVVSAVRPLAADDKIELRIISPLMIATWKDGGEIAFISACLHNCNLVEACLTAERRRAALQMLTKPKPSFYSSYGYKITLELRNQRQSCWSDQHTSIYFNKDQVAVGKAVLDLISSDHSFKHTPIPKKLEMPWKTDIFQNKLQNVTILDIVLQDEENRPVWCVSTPVNITKPDGATSIVYDYDGDFSFIDFEDRIGKIHMELVWEEEIGHFMLTCLRVELNLPALGVTVFGLQ